MPSRRPCSLGMSLQQQEIGPEARPPRRPRNRVGQGARKVPRQLPLIFEDLKRRPMGSSRSPKRPSPSRFSSGRGGRSWPTQMTVSKFSDLEYRMAEIEEQLSELDGTHGSRGLRIGQSGKLSRSCPNLAGDWRAHFLFLVASGAFFSSFSAAGAARLPGPRNRRCGTGAGSGSRLPG